MSIYILYYDSDLFYVAYAFGLYCIDKGASVCWQNNNLVIEHVVINEVLENKILGSGEWHPPGGWRDFILDKKTVIAIH